MRQPMPSSRDVGGSADNLEEAGDMPTTDDGVIHDTDAHRRVPGVLNLTSDELHRRLIEALQVMAFGTADEREAFFGEAVPVSARDQRESVRLLRRWTMTAEAGGRSPHSRGEQEPSWRG